MRNKLLASFDRIYILNLHGSSRIGEKTPEGGKDENVFDIQQGVAIALFVKLEKPLEEKKVYYADLWGLRSEKYKNLFENDVESTDWQEIEPREPYYFFVPKDFARQEEYEKFWKVTEIFKVWSSGVETGKDDKLVGFTSQEKIYVFQDIFNSKITAKDLESHHNLKPTSGWKIEDRRNEIFRKGETFAHKNIVSYAYRPFDTRFTYCCNFLRRAHSEIMKHLLSENMAIATTRKCPTTKDFGAMGSSFVGDKHFVGDQTYFFPLYLYPDESKVKLLVEKASGTEPTPEEIFNYIYAVLYSPSYRKRYEEFLKIDFPRVPLPEDYEKFKKLSELGKELVELHLLKHPSLSETGVGFTESGSDRVEKVYYDENSERVWINKEQYFDGISKGVWEYRIGAYQVLAKYLKDGRKEKRKLSLEEIEHYMRVAKAIERTMEVQGKVEEVISRGVLG
jgi:predicted helicase